MRLKNRLKFDCAKEQRRALSLTYPVITAIRLSLISKLQNQSEEGGVRIMSDIRFNFFPEIQIFDSDSMHLYKYGHKNVHRYGHICKQHFLRQILDCVDTGLVQYQNILECHYYVKSTLDFVPMKFFLC